jgi:hypothetical protein
MRYSSGNSVESVEQPCRPDDVRRVSELYAAGLQQACRTNREYCRQRRTAAPGDGKDFMTVQQDVLQENP